MSAAAADAGRSFAAAGWKAQSRVWISWVALALMTTSSVVGLRPAG